MEPKNAGLEDVIPFQRSDFQVNHPLIFQGSFTICQEMTKKLQTKIRSK